MLIYARVAYVNLIATGIVFNIRASSSHIGRMVAFSEHRRWRISVFDRRSIMNRLYWHDQQVGYVCFIPFVWEQRGVIAAVADQTAMLSHLLPMCWATRVRSWGHVMMWARFGSQGSIALNWHLRYSGTHYSGTWLYMFMFTLKNLACKGLITTEYIRLLTLAWKSFRMTMHTCIRSLLSCCIFVGFGRVLMQMMK